MGWGRVAGAGGRKVSRSPLENRANLMLARWLFFFWGPLHRATCAPSLHRQPLAVVSPLGHPHPLPEPPIQPVP
eukprot:scaffold36273_cov150-Isochrysis_galbana.AAC.5